MPTQFVVRPSSLKGELKIPGSKSQTLRALLFGTLAEGMTRIDSPLFSTDSDAMVSACRKLGAVVQKGSDHFVVKGVGGKIHSPTDEIDAGNSGIVLRFCSAVAALSSQPVTITGDHSICNQRPMRPLIDALNQLKVKIDFLGKEGFAPLRIQGPLISGHAEVSGEDSQPVSALLIAGAFSEGGLSLSVKNPGEKPWVQLTLNWLDRLDISYEAEGFTRYRLQGGSRISGFHYIVPADLSSLAFPVAQAIISGTELILTGVDLEDAQGDKALFDVFQKMGAILEYDHVKKRLHVRKSKKLHGVEVDINSFIDAIAILAVVACFAEGETRIYNASVARQKECNRIEALVKELKKMGATIQETLDGLIISGSKLVGANVHSHFDHRMAMALTVAALNANGESVIESIDCIDKTYPNFATDWIQAGANIEVRACT